MGATVAVVLAGGAGERLRPLTDVRAKPAVVFGAVFRIVDFTLSNCINSGLRQILVLTQYKSHSLSNHLKTGWNMLSRRLGQFVDEIPAQMMTGSNWYRGTADAIRQNLSFIEETAPEEVLVLSGDHVYKMDYGLMIARHRERRAGLTVAVVRVPVREAAGSFGVLEVDAGGRIVGFEEKPASPRALPGTDLCHASMGIYVFDFAVLRAKLANDLADFGRDVIPAMVAAGDSVCAFDFTAENRIAEYQHVTVDGRRVKTSTERASDSDYWRDVGTLEAYWTANLDLVSPHPHFSLYGEKWPCYNSPLHYPPAKFVHESPGRAGMAVNSIVADGVIVSGATVRGSILSPGIYVHSYSVVENSVLMGGAIMGGHVHETVIGRGCRIRNAIVDKNVKLSEGTVLGHDRAADEARGLHTQSVGASGDYIVVVPHGAAL